MRLFSAFALSVALVVTGCYDDSELREQMNNQQAEMNAALQELRAADAELNGLVSAIAARVAELEATVDGIETSVGNIGTEVDNLEAEVGGIKTDMEDIDTGLSELENSINALQNRVSQLENHVPDSGNTGNGGSGETGDDYAEQIAAMQKELADLKSAVQSSRDMYSKLESNMTGLQEMLYQHDSNIDEVRVRLESYEAFMAEFNDFKAWVQQELDIIKADIENIKSSLLELITADAELNALISALNSRVEQLEAEITALKNGESGGNGGTVTPPDNSQVEDLVARVAALEQELAAINTALESLRTKDGELEEAINSLAAIVASNKAEAETTFADLAEFNALKEAVETLEEEYAEEFGLIKSDINTIKQSLISLEEADKNLAGLISALEDRATEIETDIEMLEKSVTENIETVNSRIEELSEELIAVKTAIQDLQAKDSQIDVAIASLNASMEASQQANKNAMEAIEADLAEQLAQIDGLSESLQQHIQTATTTFATQEALSGLSAEIEQLKTDYEARFNLIESEIGGIVAMIQSMTPISEWSNGDASARYYTDWANEKNNLATVEFNYIVRPAGTAARLAQAWAENKDLMQFRAHYTITRASFDFVDMDVMDVSASDDILTVTGYVDGISEEWIKDQESFSVSLLVTDGKTDYCTPFVNIRGDLQGTDLSADETANCYMVHEPGYYRFKIHRTIDSHSAEVLWESLGTAETPEVGCLVEPELEIRNNFVYFKTNDTWKDGNALIAVKNAAGEVVWSWHIWMTGDLPQERTYNNSAGTIMGVNLGGFDRTGFESGLLYQHSRKDPFLGYASTGDVQAKSTLEWPEPVASDEQTGTYAYTVQNPTVFITMNNLNSDWFYTGTSSLPIPSQVGGVWSNSAGKSQNDPCPPGWRIPKGNTLVSVNDRESVNKYNIWSVAYNSDFTATSYTLAGLFCYDKFGGSKMSNNGDYFFSGYLSEETGVIRQGGVEGYCWAATNLGDYGYNCLQINKDKTVKHLSTAISGARAVSVRCVKK